MRMFVGAMAAMVMGLGTQVHAQAVRVTLDPTIQTGVYSGRVYLVFGEPGRQEPRQRLSDWFNPPQVIAKDASGLPPGSPISLEGSTLGFPKAPGDIAPGEYAVQAIARRNLDSPVPGGGEGDLYSEVVKVKWPPEASAPLQIRLSKVVAGKTFKETERVKLVEIVSPSLSAFHKREVKVRAGVLLPKDWSADAGNDPSRPVLYFITGFGGDHTQARAMGGMFSLPPGSSGKQPIVVVPDPTCGTGHSVFADSANNGPWGRALMTELIPEVEKRFHATGGGRRRYVTGVSSGGWSSLWLQLTYPDAFAGCWSHCPDPVDFRDFQRIDLYAANANMYTDERGRRRPLARAGPAEDGDQPGEKQERVLLWYDRFCKMEHVLGRGGQIGSFEAVFGRRGGDGEPERLYDRQSGAVNPDVARSWEPYDIRLILERNWEQLGPKLKGKLHIYAGEVDTFFLEGAVKLLKASLEKLGSDAEVIIVPGMPHTMHQDGVKAMMAEIGRN